MKIAIPSFKRSDNFLSLQFVEDYKEITYIFVHKDEEKLYRDAIGEGWNIVVGEYNNLNEKVNFIIDYFDEGEIVLYMEDDIKWFKNPLSVWLDEAKEYLEKSNLGLMTFCPTSMWSERTKGFKEGIYFGVGVLHLYKNDKELKVSVSMGWDFERSILYYKKYGKNIRNFNAYFRTKYHNNKGGLEDERDKKIENMVKEHNELVFKYSDYLKFNDKKMFKGVYGNPVLKKSIKPSPILELGYYDGFGKLYEMLEKITIPYTREGARRGFPKFRGQCAGLIRPRCNYKGYLEVSAFSKKNPEISEEIHRIGKVICPFPFETIQINKNLVCPKHHDGNNNSQSVLVSFGEYTGCNIVVDEKKYCAKNRPIIFDGAKYEHYNTDDLVGNKYSLVFFSRNHN